MAQIAYLLLCHKDPDRIIAQAKRLVAMGDRVALHFDAAAGAEDFQKIEAALSDEPGVAFVRPRHRCGWGQWSLVAATLAALKVAHRAFPAATHFYLISGDCMPTKPALDIRRSLDATGRDWINAEPFETSEFIQTGFREERLVYRHWFNERTRARAFYASFKAQRALGLKRRLPDGLTIMIGSQWWCLRRSTVDKVLDWTAENRRIMRFFKTTWIPDETFFQTVVRHLVPDAEIEPRTPTFVQFTDYGQPVTFHDDHFDLLAGEDCFFARKIGPEASGLAARLGALFAGEETAGAPHANLHRLHRFLTREGRHGRRHGPRVWEDGARLGPARRVTAVVCKKWHLAKRLLAEIANLTGAENAGFVFDEDTDQLPDLGGLQNGLAKRNRNRAAFLRVLSDVTGQGHIGLGLDPSRADVLRDLANDGVDLRVIDLDCSLCDDYLAGHAGRIGLASAVTPSQALAEIIPPLRAQVTRERDALKQIEGANVVTLSEVTPEAENMSVLARALGLDADDAARLTRRATLFKD